MANATTRWLDRLGEHDKTQGGTGSDYRISQLLGVERQMVSRWRSERDQMSDTMAILLGETLGVHPLKVVSEIREERARDAREKTFWHQVARTARDKGAAALGGIAVMVTAFVLAAFPAPSQAGVGVAADSTIYTMRTRRGRPRWWRFLFPFPVSDTVGLGAVSTVPA